MQLGYSIHNYKTRNYRTTYVSVLCIQVILLTPNHELTSPVDITKPKPTPVPFIQPLYSLSAGLLHAQLICS